MISMKLTARHLILLVLAGILVLSVPSMAGERAGANPQVVQLQSLTDEAAPTFMESVMMAVKAQLRLWLSIDSTPVVKPEIKTTTPSDGPLKSNYDPKKWNPGQDIYHDNGGEGGVQ